MHFRLSKIKVLLLLICLTGFIDPAQILADNSDIKSQSKVDEAMRRRRKPGSKSMFGDLEIFKKNFGTSRNFLIAEYNLFNLSHPKNFLPPMSFDYAHV